MDKIEHAKNLFQEGYSCSQSVFSVFSVELGLDADTAMKIASGFGGGMARMANTCGAVTGAMMVLGLKYGSGKDKNAEIKENLYSLIREFSRKFQLKNHSLLCRELLGYDISTPEGHQIVKERGISAELCPQLVEDAVSILLEIVAQEQ
ncbi:MAG: C_GCAxxG_C_C family protein [Candidatus Cloacimonetes bacterium]|nr:C_GCAxxG_C_C family protein [Candidatus Cloacimonadota bacterium]